MRGDLSLNAYLFDINGGRRCKSFAGHASVENAPIFHKETTAVCGARILPASAGRMPSIQIHVDGGLPLPELALRQMDKVHTLSLIGG